MEERMITVVIPTYNRFDCMKYFFENCFLKYTGRLFTFEIHDSSEDDRVKEYIDANIGNSPILKYFKYDPNINGDVKAMRAVLNVQTQYAYLMGDGVIWNFNWLENFLVNNDYYKFSIIGFGANKKGSPHSRFYSSAVDAFKDLWYPFTFWGATIVQRMIFYNVMDRIEKYMDINSPFTYVCSLYEGMAKKESLELLFASCDIQFSPYKKCGVVENGTLLNVWFYQLYITMSILIPIYPKEYAFKAVGTLCSNWFRLLWYRSFKHFTIKKISKFKKYILIIAGKKVLLKMCLTLFFPARLLKILYKIKHKVIK